MSGAGEGLAVLGLLIAVAVNYKKACGQPFSRYKAFPKNVSRYLTHLNNQYAIYESLCVFVLGSAIDQGDSMAMLSKSSDLRWHDENIGRKVRDSLGIREEACKNTIKEIDKLLNESNEKSYQLLKALEHESQGDMGVRANGKKLRHLRDKLSFAFSKSQLKENLEELTAFNVELESLCALEKSFAQPKGNHVSNKLCLEKVRQCRFVSEASQEVYDTLKESCSKHLEHQANLCVSPVVGAHQTAPFSQVEFDVVFASMTRERRREEPVLFKIKIVICETDSLSTPNDDAVPSARIQKRGLNDAAPYQCISAGKKRVRLDIPSVISTSTTTQASALVGPKEAIFVKGDLCDYLLHCCQQQCSATRADFVASNTRWRKLIYPIRAISITHKRPLSLQQLIRILARDGKSATRSLAQRVQLAKLITIGFLQHHPTDWARTSLQKDSIMFFDACCEASDKPLAFSSPHISAKICGPDKSSSAQKESSPIVRGQSQIEPHPMLLSLGKLLLELGNLSDWDELKRQYPIHRYNEGHYAELFQARVLARSGTGIPRQYLDVVEKVIDFQFSQGHDLSKLESQLAFYQNVIDPLEMLEKKLQELRFDD